MPEEKRTVRQLHDEAMVEAQNASVLQARGTDFDEMIACYHRAYVLEEQAISAFMIHAKERGIDADGRNPTEKILRRSAVSLLYSAMKAMETMENE